MGGRNERYVGGVFVERPQHSLLTSLSRISPSTSNSNFPHHPRRRPMVIGLGVEFRCIRFSRAACGSRMYICMCAGWSP